MLRNILFKGSFHNTKLENHWSRAYLRILHLNEIIPTRWYDDAAGGNRTTIVNDL